jgi:hypothetical protein
MTTLEALQKEFNGPTAKVEDVADKYLGIGKSLAKRMAGLNTLPIPVHRLGSRKSPWMVDLKDLANLIDKKIQEAKS